MSLHTYRADGDGLPLVLLHGFPLDHRMWDEVASLLPPGHPVHAVDLPGTPGHATDLPEPALETSADLVAEVLRAAGVERAVVAGLSMGGYVALALVERHPDLVDSPSSDDAIGRTGATEPVVSASSAMRSRLARASGASAVDLVSTSASAATRSACRSRRASAT